MMMKLCGIFISDDAPFLFIKEALAKCDQAKASLEERFKDCLGKVKGSLLKIDLSHIVPTDLESSFYGKIVNLEDREKILKATIYATRIWAIIENTGIFFWAYEMVFNNYIEKIKKFFPNIDTAFLILMDIDAKKQIWSAPNTYVRLTRTSLNMAIEIDWSVES
ncbi:hypothetical protein COCNU_01G015150 [Cocos nucifera]|uniref:Uncharacterized protein n=1 Tax=Cocos nucifera TaxID=13894 RepID=A0A8K0MV12_COCNU|nr:hypothetical protein COCNU_01G015150 [Cocos nucifera]